MFPLVRQDDRVLPADYNGVVVTCDVDKTWLDTDFKSLAGIVRIPLEWGEDKDTVAGMAPVLRGLRHGPDTDNAQTPFYFLTASPPQLSRALTRKMVLDAVQCDGITFKDWGRILRRRKPAWLKNQVPYKLSALLHQRSLLPEGATEILIGDDVEADALIYSMYADAVAGRLRPDRLSAMLEQDGTDRDGIDEVLSGLSRLKLRADVVSNIYIYLDQQTPPEQFSSFSRDLIACRTPFQLAVHLWQTGRLRADVAVESARQLLEKGRLSRDGLQEQLNDFLRRGVMELSQLRDLEASLVMAKLWSEPMLIVQPDAILKPPARAERDGSWLG